jgi:hypothetical protein
MKKEYRSPELIEYGQATQLTLGASGPNIDYQFANGALNIDSNSNCTSNTGYCLTFS